MRPEEGVGDLRKIISVASLTTPESTSRETSTPTESRNFWTLLKRAIKGTYVSVERFHFFRYLDEEVFRFNNRQTPDRTRFLRLAAMSWASA
jgi:hypothetical protein